MIGKFWLICVVIHSVAMTSWQWFALRLPNTVCHFLFCVFAVWHSVVWQFCVTCVGFSHTDMLLLLGPWVLLSAVLLFLTLCETTVDVSPNW